jgi:hypothetical protein
VAVLADEVAVPPLGFDHLGKVGDVAAYTITVIMV